MEVLKPSTESIDAPLVIEAVLSGGVAEAVHKDPLFGEVNPNYTSGVREATAMAIIGSTVLTNVVEQGPMHILRSQMPSELHGIHTTVMLEKMHANSLIVWDRTTGFVAPRPSGRRLVQRGADHALDITPQVRGVYRSPEVRNLRKALATVGITGFGVKYGIEGLTHGDDLYAMIDTIALGTGVSAIATGGKIHS